ncbi:unnamed protein product [Lasius platythorax]|uniref:Uncharacterized protein n=1 Tax=Lasius platythorax TaxID=488582 RepID=A0AAV2NM41_9HYME
MGAYYGSWCANTESTSIRSVAWLCDSSNVDRNCTRYNDTYQKMYF